MAKVITSIVTADENDSYEESHGGVSYGLVYGTDEGFRSAMNPEQIVDELVKLDPEDLADVQQRLYERCYEAGGVLT
jgi:hypothetical protein